MLRYTHGMLGEGECVIEKLFALGGGQCALAATACGTGHRLRERDDVAHQPSRQSQPTALRTRAARTEGFGAASHPPRSNSGKWNRCAPVLAGTISGPSPERFAFAVPQTAVNAPPLL